MTQHAGPAGPQRSTGPGSAAHEPTGTDTGYSQELHRGLSLWSTFSIGFATVSPVVGIYAAVSLGYITAGPSWVWLIPLVLVLQLTVASVYAELASQWPIAGGCYQWVRRLAGDRAGWFTGFLYLSSAIASLSTVAYLGGPWLFSLFTGYAPSPGQQVLCGVVFLVLALLINQLGVNPLKWFLNAGIIAEAVASIGISLALLLFFRNHDFSILFEGPASGSGTAGFLAALAVGGWAFLGFDACSQVSEETLNPRRDVPRAILRSLTAVGLVVLLTALSVTLSYKDVAAAESGAVADPVHASVVEAFGPWANRPFIAVVLIAFIACAVSIQTYLGRAIFGMARDGMLPGSRLLKKVSRRRVPHTALWTVTVLASAGLLLGLNGNAAGTLMAFGSGGFYIVFLIVTSTALRARLTGRWNPDKGALRLGRKGLILNIVAVVWLTFEAINVAWPRAALAAPGAPWIVVWAVITVFSALCVIGAIYLFTAKPHLRIATAESFAQPGETPPESDPTATSIREYHR
ncbi:APC family permease [Streptomyces sp. NPDC004609]|uniref:APC family permease n=1 Tax=Streptomyces sp. NPDC004609 TaxID=3364704 RepID=UPI00369D7B59